MKLENDNTDAQAFIITGVVIFVVFLTGIAVSSFMSRYEEQTKQLESDTRVMNCLIHGECLTLSHVELLRAKVLHNRREDDKHIIDTLSK